MRERVNRRLFKSVRPRGPARPEKTRKGCLSQEETEVVINAVFYGIEPADGRLKKPVPEMNNELLKSIKKGLESNLGKRPITDLPSEKAVREAIESALAKVNAVLKKRKEDLERQMRNRGNNR